jgi:hypothetical protein
MKEMLEKLAGKRPDEEDGDKHAHAKMQVLHELRNMAMGMMGDKVKGKLPHEMHEVDVQAPDRESLQAGLGLAQHMTGPHDSATGPKGPPSSLSADKDSSFGEHLDSKLPHKGSNGSAMDAAAEDVHEQTEHGRGEPEGDEGEPDQEMLNPHRNSTTEDDGDDMYGDMDHEELDQHIEHLKKLKQAKMMKR